jgi:hypothetical protein
LGAADVDETADDEADVLLTEAAVSDADAVVLSEDTVVCVVVRDVVVTVVFAVVVTAVVCAGCAPPLALVQADSAAQSITAEQIADNLFMRDSPLCQ